MLYNVHVAGASHPHTRPTAEPNKQILFPDSSRVHNIRSYTELAFQLGGVGYRYFTVFKTILTPFRDHYIETIAVRFCLCRGELAELAVQIRGGNLQDTYTCVVLTGATFQLRGVL